MLADSIPKIHEMSDWIERVSFGTQVNSNHYHLDWQANWSKNRSSGPIFTLFFVNTAYFWIGFGYLQLSPLFDID